MDAKYDRTRRIALALLEGIEQPSRDDIKQKVAIAITTTRSMPGPIDPETLARDIESSLNIFIGRSQALDADEDHVAWLSDTLATLDPKRPQIDWVFWERYARYLREVKRWPESVVRALDRTTTDVVKRLEDPVRLGPWDRRGMVVGHVQSGKTANFTGVISKATDAGYKLIVVLTGMHNSLRSQTQFRLDEEFLGYDTDKNRTFDEGNARMGVGKLYGARFPRIHSITSSSDDGDFNTTVAKQAGVMLGGDPVLLVVKKNVSVLRNLNAWATSILANDQGKIGGVPLLVIDDECDQASINFKPSDLDDPDHDLAAINRQIRRLLNTFEQSAYVGYTATPFASVFIHPDAEHGTVGEDLFPRSFIISLAPPSNYIGPSDVFGLEGDEEAGFEEKPEQPVIRRVTDHNECIPDRHKKEHRVPGLPRSLQAAMKAFILSCAARAHRGQANHHHSMLIHVSRFTDVQRQVSELVTDELGRLQRAIRFTSSDPRDPTWTALKEMWEADFMDTTSKMAPELAGVTWEDIKPHIASAAQKIVVKTINGTVKDILDYRRNRETGLSVIAVGGDKLSRGLTLEGLTVSYYLRATKMYDTLLQMGRWFGYRDNFADLCRIYTTPELIAWYRWIAMANEELRRDFNYMAEIDATPDEFGLRVRRHPDGLLITAINKMRASTTMKLSYADTTAETLVFHKDAAIAAANRDATARFLSQLGPPTRPPHTQAFGFTPQSYIWDNVSGDERLTVLLGYLDSLQTHQDAHRAKIPLLTKFIRKQIAQGDLTSWTVALVSSSDKESLEAPIGNYTVNCFRREASEPTSAFPDKVTMKRLITPRHETLDLTKSEYDVALADTLVAYDKLKAEMPAKAPKDAPTFPGPKQIRAVRPKTRGLLLLYPLDPKPLGHATLEPPLIGFALSFPKNESAAEVEYKVNKRYEEEYL